MSDIKTITINSKNVFAKEKPTILGKLLPYMLIGSLMFANLYYVAQGTSADYFAINSELCKLSFALDLLMFAVLDYLVLLLVLWVYRSILARKPYFYLVKIQTFNETFKFWYFVRTLIVGAFCCVLFVAPYLEVYLPVIELVMSFAVVLLTFVSLRKNIDVMFLSMYFKLLMYPWCIWQAFSILFTLFMGGY